MEPPYGGELSREKPKSSLRFGNLFCHLRAWIQVDPKTTPDTVAGGNARTAEYALYFGYCPHSVTFG